MIRITDEALCTGCGACADICPTGCIEMTPSNEMFLYPHINEKKCIDCNLCEKCCPIINPLEIEKTTSKAKSYAMYCKDEETRCNSSSGGIFSILACYILDQKGVVFGASYDENLKVRHTYAENKTELSKLCGTKYVQSDIGDSYKKAEEFLKSGRKVLFSGTPCQTDGLLSYLGKEYERLYTQDLICHGVPSPLVWEKYKDHVSSQNGSKIKSANFRDKKDGWKGYSVSFELENGASVSTPAKHDRYMNAFLNDLCLRPSCYQCEFKKPHRNTDITLADFWGVDTLLPHMYDNKGTSLVFINSKKGELLFDSIKSQIVYEETDPTESVKHNRSMLSSVSKPKQRDSFMKDLAKNDFTYVTNKYLKVSFLGKVKKVLKRKLQKLKKH